MKKFILDVSFSLRSREDSDPSPSSLIGAENSPQVLIFTLKIPVILFVRSGEIILDASGPGVWGYRSEGVSYSWDEILCRLITSARMMVTINTLVKTNKSTVY